MLFTNRIISSLYTYDIPDGIYFNELDYMTYIEECSLTFIRTDDGQFNSVINSQIGMEYTIEFERIHNAYNTSILFLLHDDEHDSLLDEFEIECTKLNVYYEYICPVCRGDFPCCYEYKTMYYVETDDDNKLDMLINFANDSELTDYNVL